MTRVEYDLLREERPELHLLKWEMMGRANQERLNFHTRESLIAAMSALILNGDMRSKDKWISGYVVPLERPEDTCPYCNPYRNPQIPMHVQSACWACGGTGLYKDTVARILAAS